MYTRMYLPDSIHTPVQDKDRTNKEFVKVGL